MDCLPFNFTYSQSTLLYRLCTLIYSIHSLSHNLVVSHLFFSCAWKKEVLSPLIKSRLPWFLTTSWLTPGFLSLSVFTETSHVSSHVKVVGLDCLQVSPILQCQSFVWNNTRVTVSCNGRPHFQCWG